MTGIAQGVAAGLGLGQAAFGVPLEMMFRRKQAAIENAMAQERLDLLARQARAENRLSRESLGLESSRVALLKKQVEEQIAASDQKRKEDAEFFDTFIRHAAREYSRQSQRGGTSASFAQFLANDALPAALEAFSGQLPRDAASGARGYFPNYPFGVDSAAPPTPFGVPKDTPLDDMTLDELMAMDRYFAVPGARDALLERLRELEAASPLRR